jgi:hypothetical protein
LLPFWALAPEIAHFLRGLSNLHQLRLSRQPSSSCRPLSGCSDVDRRDGSQVDHQGLHDEACPEGRLVNTPSRRDPA